MNQIPSKMEYCYEIFGCQCPCIDRHGFLWCHYYNESLTGFAKRLPICLQDRPQIRKEGKEK